MLKTDGCRSFHSEAQLHSTRGALGQTGLKSPRHYLSCLLEQEIACTGQNGGQKKGYRFTVFERARRPRRAYLLVGNQGLARLHLNGSAAESNFIQLELVCGRSNDP